MAEQHGGAESELDCLRRELRESGKREAELRKQVRDWQTANSPGGWIDDLRREVERLQEDVEAGLQISGLFFEALKPLNLQAINVQNPGVHVTSLITEIATLKDKLAEVEKTVLERVKLYYENNHSSYFYDFLCTEIDRAEIEKVGK